MNKYEIPVFLKPAMPPMIEIICAFIEVHPGYASEEIAASFGIKTTQLSIHTTRLRRRGLIRKSRKADTGQRSYWEAGVDPEVEHTLELLGQPNQATVSTWTPNHSRDPLVAAIFGAPRQP